MYRPAADIYNVFSNRVDGNFSTIDYFNMWEIYTNSIVQNRTCKHAIFGEEYSATSYYTFFYFSFAGKRTYYTILLEIFEYDDLLLRNMILSTFVDDVVVADPFGESSYS